MHPPKKEKRYFRAFSIPGIYGRIQQKLQEADRTLYGRLEDNKTWCEEVIRQVTVPRTEEAVAPEWGRKMAVFERAVPDKWSGTACISASVVGGKPEARGRDRETGRECNPEACRRTEPSGACEKGKTGTGRERAVWKHLDGRWRLERRKLPQPMRAGNRSWRIQIRRMQDALPLYAEQEKNGRHMKL